MPKDTETTEAMADIDRKLLEKAKGGSITAAQEYKKAVREAEVEQLKRRLFFDE